ncbi:MAG: hypothetical protein ABDH37_02505 [Candidatus Hydrothermales bacterium]
MLFKKLILNLEEKKFQKEHFLYLISSLLIRDLLESALEGDFKIFRTPSLYESLLFTIHHLFFYSSLILILVLFISYLLKEKKEKVLIVFIYFSPLVIIAPIFDFLLGGGKILSYPTSIKDLLLGLLKGEFEKQGISEGQLFEVITICFFIALYVYLKSKNILKLILSFLGSFIIILTFGGFPGYFIEIFKEGGYIFSHNSKQGLLYALITIITIPLFFKIEITYNELFTFSVWGYLSSLFKILLLKTKYDIPSPLFPFDYISVIVLPILVLVKNKKNIYYFTISLLIVFLIGEIPFIFFILFLIIDNTTFNHTVKRIISANVIFLSGSSVFFGNYSHLVHPFFFPFLLSFLVIIRKRLIRELILNSLFLILTLLTYERSFWVRSINLNENFITKSEYRHYYLYLKYLDSYSFLRTVNILIETKNYENIPFLIEKFKKEKSLGDYYFYRSLIGAIFNEDIIKLKNLSKLALIFGNPLCLPLISKIFDLSDENEKALIFLKRSLKHNIYGKYNF